MRRPVPPAKKPPKPPKSRRFHAVDIEPLCADEHENPDWVVGAN